MLAFLAASCANPVVRDPLLPFPVVKELPGSVTQESIVLTAHPPPGTPSMRAAFASPTPSTPKPPTHTPAYSPTPTQLTCWQKGGRFEHGSLESPLLNHSLDFRVFLPPCYGVESERRYPVLYLIHGQGYDDEQWQRLGAGELASSLIAAGEIPPFLIVMPRYRLWSDPDKNNFGQVVVEQLVPWVDSEYRTKPERTSRAIGGLSKGAGWAVHLGLSRWENFGAIGGHSLAVFWTDTVTIRTWLERIPRENLPRIYLDIGDKDTPVSMSSSMWFEETLTEYGIPHEWYLFTGNHDEAYWSGNLERYLRWYSKEWE
jgi:enterochelin esterase-like enzyme